MYNTIKFFILICLLSGNYNYLQAQKYLQPNVVQGEPLGVKQGLSQGMINCIYQDKDGFMWICTKDGLNRYDGYNIITYRNVANDAYSLPDNYCNAIAEDENGNLWVGTNTKGLFVFNKQNESFYPVQVINNKKGNLCIREIKYANGKLFLKTWTDALILDISTVKLKNNAAESATIIFSYNQWQPNKKYRIDNNVYAPYGLSIMPDHSIWVSFADSIFHLKPTADFSKWSVSTFTLALLGIKENGRGGASFFPLPGEPANTVIIYKNQIIHFNENTGKVLSKKAIPVPNPDSFNKYFFLNDSSICSFSDSLVYIYQPQSGSIVVSERNKSLPKGTIISFFTDASGIQWYGSPGLGIVKIDPRKKLFKSFKETHNKVNDFWNLPPVYMPGIAQQLRTYNGFNWVALDKQGIYWAYLRTSINKPNSSLLSNNTRTGTITNHPGLPDNDVVQINIYNDPQNRLWIYYQDRANKNFIARMNKATGTVSASYHIPDIIESPEPFVSQFYVDQQGIIWLATVNGLYAFNEIRNEWKLWKNIPGNSSSLSADGLLSICADPKEPEKFIWIGTEGAGLNRFNKQDGTFLRFDEKDGLPNNVVYCILADSLNNLWISTNKGLSCFNPEQKTFRNFTEDDGLPGNEFNRTSAMRLQNGELMFGGVDGFVIFNPKEILQKQPASPIAFTNISIFNKPINWKTDYANLNASVGYANLLTLKPGQNIFSISFATLEYRNNAKKMYKYKLDGFDKDWTSPSSRNEVTYTNLSPGTYTFYVMGANTAGVWNEKPINMKIVVLPRWYQTFLFKFILLSLFAAALYAFYRYRLTQGLKLEKLRNRIARDLHDEIGSNLSSISLYAASAQKITVGNKKAETILSKISIGTSEMMEAISDIVWAVNTGSDHFDELANRVRSFAVQVTEAKHIELRFTDNKDIPDITLNMEQRKNIYLICKEAINNAVKYSGCTLLEVLISKENYQLHINIHDNGKGFELSSLESPNNGHSFGGNGIKNMKSRAAEINSVLELHTYPDAGTSVKLITPV